MRAFMIACLLTILGPLAASAGEAVLRGGAATSNITPDLGGEIIGGFAPIPSQHIHDELHAKCLVLDDGKTRIALVVCDLLGLHRSVSLEARRLIEESTGIPSSHVLICGTHTHSAISALGQMNYQSDQDLNPYQKFVARRIADGVRRAVNVLEPCEIAFHQIEVPEHLFNRRWFMKEGTVPVNPFGEVDKVKMNPPAGSPNLTEPAGPTDPQVSFIAVRDRSSRLISLFAAYSLHYVGGVGDGHVSADYFGVFCDELKRLQGNAREDAPFVPMLANGTSGDVNNINFKNPRPPKGPYEQIRYVAKDLANRVHQSIAGLSWSKDVTLDARYRELDDLKWREIDEKLIAWVQATEAKVPDVIGRNDLSAIYAGRIKLLASASPQTKAPVQVIRIGDIAIGTSPCETFTETGLEFKKRSPFKKSFMVELAHGYYGYLPTSRHFALGGYETWPGTNYLEPQAADKILSATLDLAQQLAQ